MKYLFQKKDFSLGHTFKSANPYIFGTVWFNPVIFQTLVWKDIGIRKSEFVKKTQVNYK